MANRSYLYASMSDGKLDEKLKGVSEYNYDTPLCFLILLSVNTKPRQSDIFESDFNLSIAGDLPAGVQRLKDFMSCFAQPELAEMIAKFNREADAFFTDDMLQNPYFNLELGELVAMEEEPNAKSMDYYLQQIEEVGEQVEFFINDIEKDLADMRAAQKPPGFFAGLFGKKETRQVSLSDIEQKFYDAGFGYFSNVLYFS